MAENSERSKAMTDNIDAQKQVDEIHQFISESRSTFTGGGAVGIVWGILTAAGVLALFIIRPGSIGQCAIWATHNALGWTFTLLHYHYEAKRDGRVSLRDKQVTQLWAMVTLVLWMTVFTLLRSYPSFPFTPFTAVLAFIMATGMFATGLLSESMFTRIMAVAFVLVVMGIAMTVHTDMGGVYILVSMALISIIWGLGTFFKRSGK
ncbi:hypothetical protein ACFL1X_01675 [Candidatus Hydrogenedentota bacterium]